MPYFHGYKLQDEILELRTKKANAWQLEEINTEMYENKSDVLFTVKLPNKRLDTITKMN